MDDLLQNNNGIQMLRPVWIQSLGQRPPQRQNLAKGQIERCAGNCTECTAESDVHLMGADERLLDGEGFAAGRVDEEAAAEGVQLELVPERRP